MGPSLGSAFTAHRVVGRFVAHGEPVSFRALCSEVLSAKTRYLVLDLDGTVHLDRNLGELLGWELGAHRSYGLQAMERLEPGRRNSRWLLDWREPRHLGRYVAEAVKAWAIPGTQYFVWSRLASRSPWVRRVGFRKFRSDPIRAVQRDVQTTLMNQLDSTAPDVVPVLMERIWQRHWGDQVVTAEDIRWIRETFPRTEIILSSASPQAVVAFVAEQLGIVHAHGSTRDRINSGEAKIETLARAFSGLGESGVEVVGISDTAHGDDHCWTKYFTKVVDINSPAPFPLITPVHSPLEEVHSAWVLSRREIEKRASDPSYLDPRRPMTEAPGRRELTHADLFKAMGNLLQRFNAIIRSAERFTDPTELAYRLAVLRESSRASLA